MIYVVNPETGEQFTLSESSYRDLVKKHDAWRRALENAIDVPDDFPAKVSGAGRAVSQPHTGNKRGSSRPGKVEGVKP